MNKRIEILLNNFIESQASICTERAKIYTDFYKANESLPVQKKRALVLDEILKKMTIYIQDEELIVGNQACRIHAAPLFPEFGVEWIKEEIGDFDKRKRDKFLVPDEVLVEFEKIYDYWKGKTHDDIVNSRIREGFDDRILSVYDPKSSSINDVLSNSGVTSSGDGHIIADYEMVLNKGLKYVIEKAENEKGKYNYDNDCDREKIEFLESVIISAGAVINFARRYSKLAKNMAGRQKDAGRKKELLRISEICNKVPENPSGSFYEALQSCWFIHVAIQIESNGHSISFGRFDQYMFPFLKRDLKDSVITEKEALELLECFWIKANEINKVRAWYHTYVMHGYPLFQTLTLGGMKKDRTDAVNELSFLCLKATEELKLPQPTTVVRYHDNISRKFMVEAVKTLFEHKGGLPSFFNDEVAIPMLLRKGLSLEDARDWAIIGCCEPGIPALSCPLNGGTTHVNLLKILELALNKGLNKNNNITLLAGEKGLEDIENIDQLIEEFKKQMEFYIGIIPKLDEITSKTYEELTPTPFLSGLIKHRIENAMDVSRGKGPNHNHTLVVIHGVANVGNSLSAIKELVFDKGVFQLDKLKASLDSNFSGHEAKSIRNTILNKAGKYGNDIDAVDILTKRALLLTVWELEKYKTYRNGYFAPSPQSISGNIVKGIPVGATPDGRESGSPLADNLSPTPGSDINGPTAAMKSVAKMDHEYQTNGILFNMKFHPALLIDDIRILKFIDMLKTYFDLKGFQVQFNIVSREMLVDAQKNPDSYKNLVVKVAGYSAFFTSLDKALQNEIIKRTEYNVH
ncbi:MAG: formate C-acetyltransferase/glycerol dehydratase family glycyl radical enzyme [Actinobacteria bacterium]|nr:formate C-acetyltransferase/glycerol dehydratase family glycyl radical enzyme [Actinomycetota bacterium]